MNPPASEYKRVRYGYIDTSSERNLEVFNTQTVRMLDTLLHVYPEYENLVSLSSTHTQALLLHTKQFSLLTTNPFCLFSPVFTDVDSLKALMSNWPTENFYRIKEQAPLNTKSPQLLQIRHANQMYLHLIREFSGSSVLAPAIFGMSRRLLDFFGSLSASAELDLLYKSDGVPLFKWRLDHPGFWFAHFRESITRDTLAHLFMQVSPAENRIGNLPRRADWNAYGYKRSLVEDYMDALLAYEFRAASVCKIVRRTPSEVRNRFKSIHGRSSTCGNSVSSLSWFTANPKQRLHATFFTYLFRNANTEHEQAYLPFLAAMNLYERMFGTVLDRIEKKKSVTADRAFFLLSMMANDSSMNIGACNQCGTQYLLCNSPEKIELAESYRCPFCSTRSFEVLSHSRKRPKRGAKKAT